MLVCNDWTWLIHGSVFNHHWSLPGSNICFLQLKVPFVYHRTLRCSLEKRSLHRGLVKCQELPRAAVKPRPSALFVDGDVELDVSWMKIHGVDHWVSAFLLLILLLLFLLQTLFSPPKFKQIFERDSCSGGDTPSSLLSREFLGQGPRNTSTPESCLEAASKRRPSSWLTQVISKRLFLLLFPVF